MEIHNEDIRHKFAENATDNTITCGQCLALAKELSIPTQGIADMLTEMGIKIIHCQLGCFP